MGEIAMDSRVGSLRATAPPTGAAPLTRAVVEEIARGQ